MGSFNFEHIAIQGVRVRFIAAGPAACHSIIGDMEGKVYSWGRNEVRLLYAVLSAADT